jgi:hypothetical protein
MNATYPCVISADNPPKKLLKKGRGFPGRATPLQQSTDEPATEVRHEGKADGTKNLIFLDFLQEWHFRLVNRVSETTRPLPPNNFFLRVPHCFRGLSVALVPHAGRDAASLAGTAEGIGCAGG